MKKNVFDLIDDGIMFLEKWICFFGFATMIAVIFCNAVCRIAGTAIDWATDYAQLAFVWVSVLGADMALKKHRHVGVDLLVRRFPEKVAKYLMVVIYAAAVVFLAMCCYYGTRLAMQNYKRMFNTLPISYSAVTMAIPVGFGMMIYTLLRHIGFLVFNKKDYYEDKFLDQEELEAF